MLRPIKSPHPRVRLMAFVIDGADGSPAATVGADDLASITDNGAGDYSLTWKNPFHQVPVVVVSPDHANGAGSEAYLQADPTITGCRILLKSNASAAADGKCFVLVAGLDTRVAESTIPQHVCSSRIRGRLLAFKVNADATTPTMLIGGTDVKTLTRNDTGDYTIEFKNAFGLAPVAVGVVAADASGSVAIRTVGVSSVRVVVANHAGTAADTDFFLFVLGWDCQSEMGGLRRPLVSTQIRPRLLPMFLNVASGTPALSTGQDDAAVEDDDTGTHTLTFTKAFKRLGAAVATAVGVPYTACVADNTEVQVITRSEDTDTDSSGVCVLVLGYDSEDEV